MTDANTQNRIIATQVQLPWSTAMEIATKSIRKRFVRSLITMASVVLAIAFLISIWSGHYVNEGLKALDDPTINAELMKQGVDLTTSTISSKMLWLIVLSLITCSVGIVNAMLMSVTERFREIGTMKCLGAADGFIIRIFMIEAAILGLIGTAAGIVIGLAIGLGGATLSFGFVAVTAVPVLGLAKASGLSLAIGLVLCTVFAIYPAYVAASMQPVDAMRVEQ
jgi:ABC-type antimicrobial peptide transport system permease subunit